MSSTFQFRCYHPILKGSKILFKLNALIKRTSKEITLFLFWAISLQSLDKLTAISVTGVVPKFYLRSIISSTERNLFCHHSTPLGDPDLTVKNLGHLGIRTYDLQNWECSSGFRANTPRTTRSAAGPTSWSCASRSSSSSPGSRSTSSTSSWSSTRPSWSPSSQVMTRDKLQRVCPSLQLIIL